MRSLISLSSGIAEPAQINEILMGYITNTKWALHGCYEGPVLFNLIGLELLPNKEAIIQYFAVRPEQQKSGLGSELLGMVQEKYKLKKISVTPTSESQGFFENQGFTKDPDDDGKLSKDYT